MNKELKMGDIVEVSWNGEAKTSGYKESPNTRIFIKYAQGTENSIITVTPRSEYNYLNGHGFSTCVWREGYWRPKQEPKYVPFTIEDADLFKGKWVKGIEEYVTQGKNALIIGFNTFGVKAGGTTVYHYKYLYECFTFEDGSPCGKLV